MRASGKSRFVIIIFIAALLLRMVIAVGYQWYIDTQRGGVAFEPDESYYSAIAWYQALLLKNKDLSHLSDEDYAVLDPIVKKVFIAHKEEYAQVEGFSIPLSGGRIYGAVLGYLYHLFGYFPMLGRFINILIGLSMALIVYLAAKSSFNEDVARLSLTLFIFLPVQIFYSISILRDMFMYLTTALLLYSICRIKDVKTLFVFSISLLTALFLAFILSGSFFYILLLLTGSAILVKLIDFKKRKVISLILLMACFGFVFNGIVFPRLAYFLRNSCYSLLRQHTAKAVPPDAATGYKLLPERVYELEYDGNNAEKVDEIINSKKGVYIDEIQTKFRIRSLDYKEKQELSRIKTGIRQSLFLSDVGIKGLLIAYPKGLFYVFFKPFPWHIKKLTQLFASVHMILWYFLFPFMCAGLYNAFRNLDKNKFILIIFFFGLASALALREGNVGNLFRHREIISFAYVIFAANGISNILLKRKNESSLHNI